jgi:hypothetical protein
LVTTNHLSPKIGRDWMVPGQQKRVLTPGKNEKRYLAGAQDARTGELIWVAGEKKNSPLFLSLLWELTQRYPPRFRWDKPASKCNRRRLIR